MVPEFAPEPTPEPAPAALSEQDPYLLLAAAEGCAPGWIPQLLDPHTPAQVFLERPPPLPPAVARRLEVAHRPQLQATVRQWLQQAQLLGLQVLTPQQPAYPRRLVQAPLRPLVLFAQGALSLLQDPRPSVTIVGSRTQTAYGEAATRDFANVLARAGVILWSGLAYGIDSLAHRASLAQGTPTVAVLAGGLDRIYPIQHQDLAREILQQGGLLLAEAPPGLRPQRGHFPRRNRILAAATMAVLVMEAGIASGSLHTARFAAEVGTPVFALPGPYTSSRSLGCHSLIADGAQIAMHPEDLLRRLGVELQLHGASQGAGELGPRFLEDSADAAVILKLLQEGPRPWDLVARDARLAQDRFLQALLQLQAQGRVLSLAGDLLALGTRNPC